VSPLLLSFAKSLTERAFLRGGCCKKFCNSLYSFNFGIFGCFFKEKFKKARLLCGRRGKILGETGRCGEKGCRRCENLRTKKMSDPQRGVCPLRSAG
jgi:hypothetical protein